MVNKWDLQSRFEGAMEQAQGDFLIKVYEEGYQAGVMRGRFEEIASKPASAGDAGGEK